MSVAKLKLHTFFTFLAYVVAVYILCFCWQAWSRRETARRTRKTRRWCCWHSAADYSTSIIPVEYQLQQQGLEHHPLTADNISSAAWHRVDWPASRLRPTLSRIQTTSGITILNSHTFSGVVTGNDSIRTLYLFPVLGCRKIVGKKFFVKKFSFKNTTFGAEKTAFWKKIVAKCSGNSVAKVTLLFLVCQLIKPVIFSIMTTSNISFLVR